MKCPFCKEIIYHLRQEAEGVFAKSTKDPSMYHKDGNQYVDCPGCKRPVMLEETRTSAGLLEFHIAPNQHQ